MRVLVVILCAAGIWTAGVAINHAYIAGRSVADAPDRAFDLHTSALTYGGAGVICLALALAVYVITQGRRQPPGDRAYRASGPAS